MIGDVATDFDKLEYSVTTAGAVLDTLSLVSESDIPLTSDSQVGQKPSLAFLALSGGFVIPMNKYTYVFGLCLSVDSQEQPKP